MYSLVLFDLDGTLADTELVLIQTMLTFIQTYTPERKVTLHELLKVSGPPLLDTLKTYFPQQDPQRLASAFAVKAREFYPRYAKAFPGALPLLTDLKAKGISFGIVTSKLRVNALFTLEVIGLKSLVDYVISLDEVRRPKPDPEGILLALEHFQKPKSSTLFIGDTIYDYQAGVNAGVATALVTWGMKRFEKNVQPTYWLDDFDQVKEIIDGRSL